MRKARTPKDEAQKDKAPKNDGTGAMWLAIGVALGVAMGVAFNNMALGVAFGSAFGAAMMAISGRKS